MPLPNPTSDESKDDFIDRCMADPAMNEEYPENDQRFAICNSQWEAKETEAMPKEGNAKAEKRWFSTGFMAGGVGAVDVEKHTLRDAAVIRPGEALGHDLWIDAEFCAAVATLGNGTGDKGLKARFGHPNMCSEALGTFLGRWKGLKRGEDGRVAGDLFLSSTAAESPKGDLRKYVEEMAAKEPEHFGASVVFTRDWHAEDEFMEANMQEITDDETGTTRRRFQSPDPNNTRNLPHARCSELHAADLVDDPAATDGMFSGIGGASLAAEMTEWLDLHPEIFKALNDDPELLEVVERYADQLKPFLSRYTANLSTKEPTAPAEPDAAASETPEATPAEPDAELTARIASLESLAGEANAEQERLTGELAGSVTRAETAEASLEAMTTERDQAVARAETAEAERDEAQRKLDAIAQGAPPVSATPAKEQDISPWKRAQKR